MNITQISSGLYNIRPGYLNFLHNRDYRVQYDPKNNYTIKPFLGCFQINGQKYFIPLSSPKRKNISWNYVGDVYFMLHETISRKELRKHDVIKKYYANGDMEKILSILNINNMIPVPDGCYFQLTIPTIHDSLLRKEYQFCSRIQSQIIGQVLKVYTDQVVNRINDKRCCNFQKLEHAETLYRLPKK